MLSSHSKVASESLCMDVGQAARSFHSLTLGLVAMCQIWFSSWSTTLRTKSRRPSEYSKLAQWPVLQSGAAVRTLSSSLESKWAEKEWQRKMDRYMRLTRLKNRISISPLIWTHSGWAFSARPASLKLRGGISLPTTSTEMVTPSWGTNRVWTQPWKKQSSKPTMTCLVRTPQISALSNSWSSWLSKTDHHDE